MSKSFSIEIATHNSIYIDNYEKGNYENRLLRVDYTEPDMINSSTGILLLIPGYGANINSNVYKKMRNLFSDKHNLIVMQCDYFGSQFMQMPSIDEIDNLFKDTDIDKGSVLLDNEVVYKKIDCSMNESRYNLNDMGIMQAIDNIVATLEIIRKTRRISYKY